MIAQTWWGMGAREGLLSHYSQHLVRAVAHLRWGNKGQGSTWIPPFALHIVTGEQGWLHSTAGLICKFTQTNWLPPAVSRGRMYSFIKCCLGALRTLQLLNWISMNLYKLIMMGSLGSMMWIWYIEKRRALIWICGKKNFLWILQNPV